MKPDDLKKVFVRANIQVFECPSDGYTVRWNPTTRVAEYVFGTHGTLKREIAAEQLNYYLSTGYWK